MKHCLTISLILCALLAQPMSASPVPMENTGPVEVDRETMLDGVAMVALYPVLVDDLIRCKTKLRNEREKKTRFWRRISFWIPVVAMAFTGGIYLGRSSD